MLSRQLRCSVQHGGSARPAALRLRVVCSAHTVTLALPGGREVSFKADSSESQPCAAWCCSPTPAHGPRLAVLCTPHGTCSGLAAWDPDRQPARSAGRSLYATATEHGVALPASCLQGSCTSCVAMLLSGGPCWHVGVQGVQLCLVPRGVDHPLRLATACRERGPARTDVPAAGAGQGGVCGAMLRHAAQRRENRDARRRRGAQAQAGAAGGHVLGR